MPLDGRNAWPSIVEGKPSAHDAILLNTTPTSGAIRLGDWKLVLNGGAVDSDDGDAASAADAVKKKAAKKKSAENSVELFDLAKDPYEKTNLAAANPAKVAEFRARYDSFAAQAVPPKSQPRAPGYQTPKVWGEKD